MTRRLLLSASLLTGFILLAGCQSIKAEPQPAWLTNMSPAIKAELQQAITELIAGQPVKLADTVFSNSHRLFIEQAILRDAQGLPIMGRHSQPAILLELQQADGQCLLSHPASGRFVKLSTSDCQRVAVADQ
ncbi:MULTISPECIES: hypothetical protein [unclassified Arsukibacterium]|uniref:hypothetical protein n=1 Tax=unclassified Arsukibacterium TaxID=2635278 RepID=UPI000C45FBE9|nr:MULTISPECIES: hypothetical protein [unclassified Arsukibacterium]MAA95567.1 hypothetical protein [Rheinheimera sp.]MBM32967.1 hypothetical protein [Rheinheimera sp.]HAW92914.1 hypothetical protein [Candidatus Azambacteria bacterium]|tara:strand:- start:488 stop:883 length:396 start_codon:yes stop_codon:yes gene_type:complete